MIAIHIYIGNLSTDPTRHGRPTIAGEVKYLCPESTGLDHTIEAWNAKARDFSLDDLDSMLAAISEAVR